MKIITAAFCLLCMLQPLDANQSLTKMIQKLNQSVVSVETNPTHSAYLHIQGAVGTGFVINKERGIILTNSHMISPGSICRYLIRFENGQDTQAKLMYYDPWQDFAFLKVDPKQIPAQTAGLKLKPNAVIENEEVFLIGNNGGREFSFLSGRVASRFDSTGLFPNQSFRVTMNSAPGSSGSPVLNMQGEVIGINHSGNSASSAFALPSNYILDALNQLLHGKLPLRKHTGALVDYVSLGTAEKHYKLPVATVQKYLKTYPEARSKILQVFIVLPGSPAEGVLMPGDIVTALNGNPVGPNLYAMDKILDSSTADVKIEFYRNGKKHTASLGTYNLQANKIERLVIAGGATFYTVDDVIRLQTGMFPGSVAVTNTQRGGSFSYAPISPIPNTDKTLVKIAKVGENTISSLGDVEALFQALNKETHLNLQYQNYGYYFTYGGTPMFSHAARETEVTYNPLDGPMMIFEYDHKQMEWVKK